MAVAVETIPTTTDFGGSRGQLTISAKNSQCDKQKHQASYKTFGLPLQIEIFEIFKGNLEIQLFISNNSI